MLGWQTQTAYSRMAKHGNFISEWFGHRVYPKAIASQKSIEDQSHCLCPFLTAAKGTATECVKAPTSKGVCTINSASNGGPQDWVVCPYRIFDHNLLKALTKNLYEITADDQYHLYAAPLLEKPNKRLEIFQLLAKKHRVFIYFDQKLGGEIQISATSSSPQMLFDVTVVELFSTTGEDLTLGKFAIMEIQTMDFHGSYRKAVERINSALELHPSDFHSVLNQNQWWLSEKIEGPNIANVFKRTFYQLMFKFRIAASRVCAGCVITVPESVWDGWQPFLGSPTLRHIAGDEYLLPQANLQSELESNSWIYVVSADFEEEKTPSQLLIKKRIRCSAKDLAHYAIEEAPKAAIAELESNMMPILARRIRKFWDVPIHFD